MTRKRVSAATGGIILPDGKAKSTNMIGDIGGVVCSKNGRKIFPCKMKDVIYCKKNISTTSSALTKRQRNRWRLYGDENKI
eukprot:5242854-Ditylum_brightwellii.AAC.1